MISEKACHYLGENSAKLGICSRSVAAEVDVVEPDIDKLLDVVAKVASALWCRVRRLSERDCGQCRDHATSNHFHFLELPIRV